jgi:Spy/CpxP family protein refolding chaperone
MPKNRSALMAVLIALAGVACGCGPLAAQAGYPPPAPGMAPPAFGNPTQQHFDILRQRDSDRRSFDGFQRSQQREADRNLETLRRQQRDQQRQRDADRRRGREADEARTAPGLAVQGRGRRGPLTEAERDRVNRAATRSLSAGTPSIMIEDRPRRR